MAEEQRLGAMLEPRRGAPEVPPQVGSRLMDALMHFFMPNTTGGQFEGAPNPLTPPLWRNQRNLDDPLLNPPMPEDPRIRAYRGMQK